MGMHDRKEKKLRVYIDGKRPQSIANVAGTFPTMRGGIWIGDPEFAGEIYGVRIFDWALHTEDMRKVFKQGK